jgi:hypothetical protein
MQLQGVDEMPDLELPGGMSVPRPDVLAPGYGMPPEQQAFYKGIQPAGQDQYGNPLFASSAPSMGGEFAAGEKFYKNKPGLSVQDLYEAKAVVPEMISSVAMGWKKGMLTAGTTAALNKLYGTTQVDVATGQFRDIPTRLKEMVLEGVMAAGGEGLGRLASHIVTKSVPTALTKLWRRVTNAPTPSRWVDADGNLTAETLQGLKEAGVSPEDVTEELVDQLQRSSNNFQNAAQAVKAAEAKMVGHDVIRASELTDNVNMQAGERALAQKTPSRGGDILREGIAAQTRTNRAELMGIGEIPITKDTSDLAALRLKTINGVRNALGITEAAEKKAAGALYDAAYDLPQGFEITHRGNVEAAFDTLVDDVGQLDPRVTKQLQDILVSYGYRDAPDDVVLHELTIDNMQKLIARLNKVIPAMPDNMQGYASSIKYAIMDDLAASVPNSAQATKAYVKAADLSDTVANYKKIAKFNEARAVWQQYSKDWKNSKLIQDLVARADGPIPRLGDSDAYTKIARMSADEAKFIVAKLGKSLEGTNSLKEMRATIVLNLLEDSMDNSSRALGAPVLASDKFIKNMDAYADGTLKEIFTPGQLSRLRRLRRVIERQKSSALTSAHSDIEDAANVMDLSRSLLQSVWLYLHNPFVATSVAVGKVGIGDVHKVTQRKAAEGLVKGIDAVTDKKFQLTMQKGAMELAKDVYGAKSLNAAQARRLYEQMLTGTVGEKYPNLMEALRVSMRASAKESARAKAKEKNK